MRAHMTDKRASISLIFIWLVSFLVALPILLYREEKSRQWLDHLEVWCDDTWPSINDNENTFQETTKSMKMRSAYFISVSVIMYFIPMLVMGIAYAVIIHKLWISTIPGELVDSRVQQQARTKKKVIVMLVSILVVFCICWMPCQIMLLFSESRSMRTVLGDWYYDLQFSAYTMAYSNSALNPLIYAGFNKNFKQGR
ncbi:hypothetical protein FSP39_009529 [Pinctada imbricata]|uniref:G-protein coupled receptors family 1 profile domain-containing protein n=1 Tax=Pinctada imbricata TaxID=66713 RepID=A0AA88XQV6_PINIB|nr:hypothetical protein FSP39_009529 [Pinctada imbricata]